MFWEAAPDGGESARKRDLSNAQFVCGRSCDPRPVWASDATRRESGEPSFVRLAMCDAGCDKSSRFGKDPDPVLKGEDDERATNEEEVESVVAGGGCGVCSFSSCAGVAAHSDSAGRSRPELEFYNKGHYCPVKN